MPIPFACPHCNHETLVEDKYAGQAGNCVQCGQPINVPLASTQGAVVPQEKVDLTGGSAAGVAITCGLALLLVMALSAGGISIFWLWFRLGW